MIRQLVLRVVAWLCDVQPATEGEQVLDARAWNTEIFASGGLVGGPIPTLLLPGEQIVPSKDLR